jgi:hypothetical protein
MSSAKVAGGKSGIRTKLERARTRAGRYIHKRGARPSGHISTRTLFLCPPRASFLRRLKVHEIAVCAEGLATAAASAAVVAAATAAAARGEGNRYKPEVCKASSVVFVARRV